jgi:hypothetical protein
LPATLFINYKSELGQYEKMFYDAVESFLVEYDDLVTKSAFQLGDLFNREDYPHVDKVRSKFGFNYSFSPVPESGDFRVDIGEQGMAELRGQYESAFNDRLKDAMREPWEKLHKNLVHISEKLTDIEGDDDSKKRYHDTLITNPLELCELLTKLNVTNDPKLEEARRQVELTMLGANIESIKEDAHTRNELKSKVDNILKRFEW